MTKKEMTKVIGHAEDHVAYRWAPCLPCRHDRRFWTGEEKALYSVAFKGLNSYRKEIFGS